MLENMDVATKMSDVEEVDFSFDIPRPDRFRVELPAGSADRGRGAKPRKMELRDEMRRLYDAASFLPWETGMFFNAHITINAASLGFQHWIDFSRKVTEFNKEMNRCLYDGDAVALKRAAAGLSVQRVSRRSLEVLAHPHYWMSVLEYGRERGGHLHQLCVVPKSIARAFKTKTLDWWTKNSPGLVQSGAIDLRVEHPTGVRRKASLQREYFRYLTKTASSNWGVPLGSGEFLAIRQIFKPYPNDHGEVYVSVSQLAQISHRLSARAQQAAGFKSYFSLGRYDEVYDAWEMEPYNRQERARRRAKFERLDI